LSRLRSGQVKSPGRDVLLGLCQYFKVPPSYFFPELESPITEDEEENALRIVTRSAKVSPAVKQKLEELLRAMREDESQEEK
jgi:transcriptional regulator with XRE-family HTH domain